MTESDRNLGVIVDGSIQKNSQVMILYGSMAWNLDSRSARV